MNINKDMLFAKLYALDVYKEFRKVGEELTELQTLKPEETIEQHYARREGAEDKLRQKYWELDKLIVQTPEYKAWMDEIDFEKK